MIPNIEKILKEWSYRVGVIKTDDKEHLFQLQRILINEGWPLGVINEVIQNLTEIAPTDMVSNPNPKGKKDKVQYQYAKQWMDKNPDAETSDDFKKDVGKEKDTKKKKLLANNNLTQQVSISDKNGFMSNFLDMRSFSTGLVSF